MLCRGMFPFVLAVLRTCAFAVVGVRFISNLCLFLLVCIRWRSCTFVKFTLRASSASSNMFHLEVTSTFHN